MINTQRVMVTAVAVFMLAQAASIHAKDLILPTLGCMLQPSEKVQISSPVTGVLDKVMVKRGDSISIGDPLFELKAGVEREAVQLARVRAEFAQRKEQRSNSDKPIH